MKQFVGKGPNTVAGNVVLAIKDDEIGDSLSICLSEQSGSANVWDFYVKVTTSDGDFVLGGFSTRPPISPRDAGDFPARVVALASCPGARGWRVFAYGPSGAIGKVSLQTLKLSNGGLACCDPITPANGSRLKNRVWTPPANPAVYAVQGTIKTGPGTLTKAYGLRDPATAACYFGFVDTNVPIVNGNAFRVTPIHLPAGAVENFEFHSLEPEGIPFVTGIRWCLSSTSTTVTLLGAGGALVQAERI